MKTEPDGINNIVTLIKVQGKFQYYITDKETWILNNVMLKEAFERAGYKVSEFEDDIRYGFAILSDQNIHLFIERLNEYHVTKEELKSFTELYSVIYDDAAWVVRPVFYIDFDARVFYSFYTEPGSYERYMPDGWKGHLYMGDPDAYVPSTERYW